MVIFCFILFFPYLRSLYYVSSPVNKQFFLASLIVAMWNVYIGPWGWLRRGGGCGGAAPPALPTYLLSEWICMQLTGSSGAGREGGGGGGSRSILPSVLWISKDARSNYFPLLNVSMDKQKYLKIIILSHQLYNILKAIFHHLHSFSNPFSL